MCLPSFTVTLYNLRVGWVNVFSNCGMVLKSRIVRSCRTSAHLSGAVWPVGRLFDKRVDPFRCFGDLSLLLGAASKWSGQFASLSIISNLSTGEIGSI